MNTVPIWTAFVTQFIGQKNWMKRVGRATIQFRELRPYVFHPGYTLPRGPSGRYQLTFTSPDGTLYSFHMRKDVTADECGFQMLETLCKHSTISRSARPNITRLTMITT
jgi:hypothetical protein